MLCFVRAGTLLLEAGVGEGLKGRMGSDGVVDGGRTGGDKCMLTVEVTPFLLRQIVSLSPCNNGDPVRAQFPSINPPSADSVVISICLCSLTVLLVILFLFLFSYFMQRHCHISCLWMSFNLTFLCIIKNSV